MAASICIEAVQALGGLAADKLALERGGRELFRALGFRASAGEAISVEGPNGAGKTSLLRLLAGFLQQASGTITLTVSGGSEVTDAEERGKFVGWLGHQDGVKPQLSPFETLAFYSRFYGADGDIAASLAEVGLGRARDLPAQYLSAGQKKRVALARLKLSARPLWLLDEPLVSLDTAGKALAAQFIQQHCRAGGIAIAATHEPLGIECTKLILGAHR
jgi:heme exporter protein A